jgi:hypothetical protein
MANWATRDRLGNPLDPGWQQQNLQTISLPGGQSWNVYRPAASSFEGFLNELAATGYPVRSSGGFNYRNIAGSDRLSQHAFGTAIDINAAANPRVAPGGARVTDLPANVGEMAARYGLEWGGTWKRPDAMHFEWAGGNQPNYQGAPTPVEPFDIFGGREPASGLSDTARSIGMGMAEPPMTPERFLYGMMAGENPLKKMVFNKVLSLLA